MPMRTASTTTLNGKAKAKGTKPSGDGRVRVR